jgi:tetratricopeptide (TPR) repeat protein
MIDVWKSDPALSSVIPGKHVVTMLDQYEFWFRKAYLFPIERQRFLQDTIRGKPIGAANFALASILASGKTTGLVVTTNFDRCVSRALMLLGKEPLIFDHPATANSRFRLDPGEIQVLHVHGTYQYYDCANLKSDIRNQADKMAELVSGILNERFPIVVGYSGWEHDVFMTRLKRHLYGNDPLENLTPEELALRQRRLPYPVVWFCYRPSELDSLPAWLKEHENVFFVVPESTTIPAFSVESSGGLQGIRDSTALSQPAEPKLPAEVVFQLIASELGVRQETPPNIVALQVRELRGLVQGLTDSLVDKVEQVVGELLDQRRAIADIYRMLQELRWREALNGAVEIADELDGSEVEVALEVLDLLCKATLGAECQDSSKLATGWDSVIRLCEKLSAHDVSESVIDERWAKAWASKGVLLMNEKHLPQAIEAFDTVVNRWPEPAPAVQDIVASSLVNKGIALCRMHTPESDNEEARHILSLYDMVLNKYPSSTDPELRETLASARVNKAYLLTMMKLVPQGLALYEEVIQQFGDSAEPAIREHVARAMINKAYQLGELFNEEGTRQAHRLYEDVIARLSTGSRPSMRTKLALALNGFGWQSLLLAKLAIKNREDPMPHLEKAREALRRAKDICPGDGLVQGNVAYVEFLAGNKVLARELLETAIRTGGEPIRQMEIRDSTIYPVDGDSEFAGWAKAAPASAQSEGETK